MNNELIVKSIKDLCKQQKITVNQLETKIGLSQGLISRWLRTTPSLDRIVDVADFFNVSLDKVIGRNENGINDDFIKILYDKTVNGEIQWCNFTDELGIKQYRQDFENELFFPSNDYQEFFDKHKEKSYFFKYNCGYISIYAMYEYHNITSPKIIKLFIQPDLEAELIPQPYSESELLSLWLKILISLNNQAPDEIKAEELKLAFMKINNKIDNCKQENNVEKYKNILTDNNYSCCLINKKNGDIIDYIYSVSTPSLAQAFYEKNINLTEDFFSAEIVDKDILVLESQNMIMKLKGLSSCKKNKAGFEILLKILKESGFDIVEKDLQNKVFHK